MVTLLRTAVANREIARLHSAWTASAVGNWAFTILLALYAYEQGGASAVGVAALVRMLPSALLASYAALLADRHSRRAVLLVSLWARAALLAATGALVLLEAPLVAVLAVAAAFTAVGTAHKPAQAALLPQLARTPDELAAGNVAWSSLDNLGFLLGSLAAGALAGFVELWLALALCGAPFALAALVTARMARDRRPEALPDAPEGMQELLEGFRVVGAHRELRLLVAVYGADVLVQAILDVLLVVVALEVLDMGISGVGWLSAAWGVGGLLGGVAAMVLLRSGRLAGGIASGCTLAGLPMIVIGVWASAGPALALLVVLGLGFGLLEIALLTLTQRLAADDVLGRVYGVQETVFVLASAIGSLLAVALVALLGGDGALIVTGAILPLVAVLVGPRLGMCETAAPVPARAFTLLRALPIFAPLPVATVENLATRAQPERVAAGKAIIVEGELGETFYVIDDGTVEVTDGGVPLIRRHPGEFFGEIALVRDVPRTATVTAVTDVQLLALGRDEFLAGIGASPRSGHEVKRVVAERSLRP